MNTPNTDQVAALVIHLDGHVERLKLPRKRSLETLYKVIGCTLVEAVSVTDRLDMWVDEEGINRQPVNPLATKLAHRYRFGFQGYHGPAVLAAQIDGDIVSLGTDELDLIETQIDELR